MLSMLNLNAISARQDSKPVAKAFYLMSSYFNHSCLPNLGCDFDGGAIRLTLAEDVPADSQLFISYVDNPEMSQSQIKEFLWLHYGFHCQCPLCTAIPSS